MKAHCIETLFNGLVKVCHGLTITSTTNSNLIIPNIPLIPSYLFPRTLWDILSVVD